jgi:hypothetical protein
MSFNTIHNTSSDIITDENKAYFDPGSNLLGCYAKDVLENPIYMEKWIDFLHKRKDLCINNRQNSFVEHISTYSQVKDISSLDMLADWDKKLIKQLESKGFTVMFKESRIKTIPATTSVYIQISR